MSPEPQSIRVEHELFMRTFFAVQPPLRVMNQFASNVRDLYLDEGEVIFERGQPPRRIYFVVEGTVQMEDAQGLKWIFEARSLVGIGDANLGRPHARTATAATDVHLLAVEVEDYFDILEDNFDFARTLLLSTCRRVHELALELPPDEVFPAPTERSLEQPWLAVKRLNDVQKLLILRNTDFAEGAPIQPLVVLARAAVEKRLEPGDVLVDRDDALDRAWFVGDGLLVVERDEPELRGRFQAGSFVLGIAGLGHDRSPYRVEAKEKSVVIGVPKEALYDMMEDHFGLARQAFAYLSRNNERVRARLADLGHSRAEDASYEQPPLRDPQSGRMRSA